MAGGVFFRLFRNPGLVSGYPFARVTVKIMYTQQKLSDSGPDYFEHTSNIIDYPIVELQ